MRPLGSVLLLLLFVDSAQAQPAPVKQPGDAGDLIVAIYLPGMFLPQLSGKLELGMELAEYLSRSLSRRAVPRVYATAAALEADAARTPMVGLVESPYVASRLSHLLPLCVATDGSREETHILLLGGGPVSDMAGLSAHRLAYASLPYDEELFLDNFVFEGELQLRGEQKRPARDAASALSEVSLRKAEAVLLYEGDADRGRSLKLRTIYQSAPLPRPTLVSFERSLSAQEVQQVRDALTRFAGRSHPQLRSFRPTGQERYQALLWHMQRHNQRLPPLLELTREDPPLRLPQPRVTVLPLPPLRTYAPQVPGP